MALFLLFDGEDGGSDHFRSRGNSDLALLEFHPERHERKQTKRKRRHRRQPAQESNLHLD